jgi:endonuclease YncB( thermonuclease family)
MLLAIFFLLSLYQYVTAGQVTWITSSFRWIESSARSVRVNPKGFVSDSADSVRDYASDVVDSVAKERSKDEPFVESPSTISRASISWSDPAYDLSGRVVKVTDGDTITILDADNTEYKVRLTGIDAPERGQPYGSASRKHLASLVAGKEVFVESDKQDIYGRELGKVWVQPSDCPSCGKTLDANYAQILAGMAWWYRYYAKEQSPEDRGRYESAEDEAKARGWGLWADPDPINPYDWRKSHR